MAKYTYLLTYLVNNNFPLPQVPWAREIWVSGTRKSVLLAKSSGERRTPRNFGLLLTLRGTHVHHCNLS